MKVMTQMGLLDINPESVVAIRKAPLMPDNAEFCDLTHCVEFDDRFYSMGDLVVCISEEDAEALAELSGVEIEWQKEKRKPERMQQKARKVNGQKTVFVPFHAQLSFSEWEKHFDEKMAWRAEKFVGQGKESVLASSSPFSDGTIKEEENMQSESLIEKAFQEQEKGPT